MIPEELQYTKTHEWVRLEGDVATIGITHFAQEQLGDLTFIELPQQGDTLETGEEMGTVESVKAASEIYAPLNGEVIEINSDLEDAPELVNESPYEKGWFVKVKYTDAPEGMLSAAQYAELATAGE